MISCILKGGLGNQMFQISAVISLALENKVSFCFDEGTWPRMGGAGGEAFQASPPKKYLNNVFRKLPFRNIKAKNLWSVYNEPSFHYNRVPAGKNLLLNGYFQSEKYFATKKEIIKKVFSPPPNIIKSFNEKIASPFPNSETVAIHVRRGSHLRNPHYHGSCDAKYFHESIAMFDGDFIFVVFSDDMEWCKSNFCGQKFIFVENQEDYEDLYYMSLCNHNIICNSTFSWWSAWLNKNNNKKVISPKKWFGPGYASHNLSDLIPKGWIVVDNGLEGE